jgi:hypothetical protein
MQLQGLAADKQAEMGPVKRWMRRKGVTVADIPKVATAFYAAKWCTFMVCLGVCVRFRPVQRTFRSGAPKRWKDSFQNRYPVFYGKTRDKVLVGANKLAESRFFKPVSVIFRTKVINARPPAQTHGNCLPPGAGSANGALTLPAWHGAPSLSTAKSVRAR